MSDPFGFATANRVAAKIAEIRPDTEKTMTPSTTIARRVSPNSRMDFSNSYPRLCELDDLRNATINPPRRRRVCCSEKQRLP